MRISLLLILSALTFLGCQPEKPDLSAARQQEAEQRAEAAQKVAKGGSAAVAAMAAAALSPEEAAHVLARVGDQEITAGHLARMLERLPKHMRARYAGLEARKELLKRLVEMEVLAREAKEQGFEKDPVVQHVLKQTLANELMRQQGETETATVSDIPMTEVQAYYAANSDKFVSSERRRAAVLYVDTKDEVEGHGASIREAIKGAPLLARQIFGDYAQEKSIDRTTRALKGDVGWFNAQGKGEAGEVRAGDVLVKAVFALKTVHDITPPIEMNNGSWAIAQMTNRSEAKTRKLEEVALEIKDALLRERRIAKRQAFLDELMARTKVEVDEAALGRVKLPTGEEAASDAPNGSQPPLPPKVKLSPKALRHARPDLRPRPSMEQVPIKMDPTIRLKAEEIQDKMRREREQSSESQ
ncbi:MAG: peptidyl-prolyl cis-trans isomerase [Myxococcota bacterium]|nr:peptidyl-prolyl cis-trans isomerase [Myxococcota bacterium]